MIWLTPPTPVSKLSLFVSLSVCRRWSILTEEGGGWGWGRSQIIKLRESLVLYKCSILSENECLSMILRRSEVKSRMHPQLFLSLNSIIIYFIMFYLGPVNSVNIRTEFTVGGGGGGGPKKKILSKKMNHVRPPK
jgi:hypothetical protein